MVDEADVDADVDEDTTEGGEEEGGDDVDGDGEKDETWRPRICNARSCMIASITRFSALRGV